ncbi:MULTISPECIES: HdeD family acid-resistance protein [Halococcus]|uniref:HdeD protein n=1 Tax=Halococcus salifodinae DSM 8989 TaxID=1227456 RepID=M0ND69_9EURY|nr:MULTISPECIES: HdeD family acid-resistance protein [Halococcus]EMA55493.1 hypothetical protein C450_01964 [Halococcus salifodinae DSM 8989]
MSEETTVTDNGQSLATSWRSLAIVGVLTALFGVLAIVFPFVTGVSFSVLLGVLLVAGGFVHVAHAFTAQDWKGRLWQVLLAGLYGVAGIALLVNPLFTLATLTLILAAFFFADGIIETIMGLRLRGEDGWAWLLASGVLSIVVGAAIWIGWPSTALWVVGLLFGINLLSTGLSMLVLAMGGRNHARGTEDVSQPGTKPRGA